MFSCLKIAMRSLAADTHRNGTKVIWCSKPPDLRSVGDIVLNPSLRNSIQGMLHVSIGKMLRLSIQTVI